MLDTCMERQRRAGLLLRTLICWTLIGLCCAGHRPYERGERARYARHHNRWTQRIVYPSMNDEGAQRVLYPSVNDEGQRVQYPSVNDSQGSAQIQRCAPGFYRDGSGPLLGRCVPCECNGLADECEERTGRCLNCRHNTAGDRCDRCKEGYYGNAARGTCRVCPCPFSVSTNSFAVGCREVFGDFQCICRAGYTGDRCESCAPGYFGEPLTPGGSCQPCNCNGNGNNCDPKTGVCKNTLEPGDTNTDENCHVCDNCGQTLLLDLEKLDDELGRIKAQLENASAATSSQQRLKKLEKAIADTKILVNKFTSAVNTQTSRVDQLEDDAKSLSDDISTLKEKADKSAADADKAVADVDKTHKRAKDLDSQIKAALKKIQDLLDQLKEAGTSGGQPLPSENLAEMLEDAQRMVNEMEKRDFTPQKTAAEKELDEAKKLLDYVKANVSKQCDENEAAAEKLRDQLKEYEEKLKDLEKAMKEATDFVKKANTQNGLNAQALEDLQKRIEDLKKEEKIVKDQVAMAENELQKTENLAKKLSDSKTEYEKLAAQLDGAKTDLTKKVNEISKAAAKEDLVEAAEEHAKNLAKLAKELEESVKNASGRAEVRNAKDAIDAYKNITDAINAAERAAQEAKDAADNALNTVKNQGLTDRAKDLKDTSDDLLRNAEDANKALKDAKRNITEVTNRLKNADDKKKALQKDLQDIQNELNGLRTDDIGDMIADAKRKAAAANDSSSSTMDKLNAIKKDIEKISVAPVDSNLGNVLNDVDQTVKDLLNTIPSLNDKIAEVENLTSQSSPINNITDNIKKIKELIEQARDAANRVVVPMKFTGEGYVELRPPQSLEDLKAYTSLSLSLQRPSGRGDGRRRRRQSQDNPDMFVLYLGNRDPSKNYIGMVLRKGVLYGVYKLNGEVHEMKSGYITTSPSEPATFDRVDLRRIYQDAEMILTKDISSLKPADPIRSSFRGPGTKNLLDVSLDDIVFYVGGYPADFSPPPPLKYPMYNGCMEFVSFNDKVIGLYNFQKAEKINLKTPCKRYVPPIDSDYYEGTGYGKVSNNKFYPVMLIDMTLYTRAHNALLFYIGHEDDYIAVSIEKGVFVIRSNVLEEPATSNVALPQGSDWPEILIIIKSNQVKVRVTGTSGQLEHSVDTIFKNANFREYYIGGAPQDLRDRHNLTIQPYKGCMKNLKLNRVFSALSEKVGVSKGCPTDSLMIRKAEFNLGSSLSADLTGFSLADDVSVSLGFMSTENQGLILQDKDLANGMNLVLENGHVVFSFNNKKWKSNKQYHDDKWHYLTATRRSGRIELLIDDEDAGQEQSGSTSITSTGGTLFLGQEKFKGCISNLYTRRPENLYRAEDFSTFQASGDILLDSCTADSPAQLMLDRAPKKDGMKQAMNETLSPCPLPAQVQHAYRIGGPVSSLSYGLPLQVLQPRPTFSLDVKTRAPEGLLFFAATRQGRTHLALYISKGRVRLSIGKQKEIFNREKYNDGKWHSVIFSLEKKKFRLVVDGIRAQDGQLTSAELASMQHFESPVYLGSVPESLHNQLKVKALPKHGASGCIRNFKMNGALMLNPTTNRGAGPCFEGPTQRGAYFSGNGAHVIINESFAVDSDFELLFNIRPRSPTGLLLHVGSRSLYAPGISHYLSVYMLRGEVVAQVNNGKGEFMASVKPKASLCDGMFHKISVIKRKNVVQLHVDTIDNYKIGPSSSTPALTKDPLYVGGIPEMLVQQTLPVTSSFVGCILDLKYNSEPVSFDRLPGVFGPVNLRECPG